jgi:hypothetical protein
MSNTASHATRGSISSEAAAVLWATVGAVAIWVIARAGGADLTVDFPGQPPVQVTVVNVIVAALVGSLAGWGLLVLLRRFTAKHLSIWTVIAIIAALASLGGPLSAIASLPTKISLVAMHVTVAVVLILLLRRNAHK